MRLRGNCRGSLGAFSMSSLGSMLALEYGEAMPAEARSGHGFPVFGSNGEVGKHCSFLVAEPGIIVGRKGSVGKVTWSDEPFWPIDTTYWVKCASLDRRWMYWVLTWLPLARLDSSTGVPGLNRNDVYRLTVGQPPSSERQKIAQILDTLDTAIKETEAIIAKLKAVKQGLLHDLLTRGIDDNGELRPLQAEAPQLYSLSQLGPVPKEWSVAALGSLIAEPPRNGLYKPPDRIGHGTLLVGQTAFTDDGSVDFELARRAQTSLTELAAFGLQAGDLLVSRVFATLGGVGQPVAVPELPEPAVYESNMMRLRVRPGVVTSSILLSLLKLTSTRAAVRSRAFLSNQASINRSGICSVQLPLPPWKEQLAISARVMSMTDRLKRESETLAKLRQEKQGLMDDLLTGRVRVTPLLEQAAA